MRGGEKESLLQKDSFSPPRFRYLLKEQA